MPVILALDTTTDACSVAVVMADGNIRETVAIAAREHTRRILPMVESLLTVQKLTLRDLDAIAFGRGPGSFTGLRIGLSVAQGLAWGTDLPLIGISSLAAMARKAFRLDPALADTIIVPVLDARMEEVYWSAWQAGTGEAEWLAEEQVADPEQCAADILALATANKTTTEFIGIGSGWRYPALKALPTARIDPEYYPTAHDVAELAVTAFCRGEMTGAADARLQYLRNEISWQKRRRIRTQASTATG